MAAATPTSSRPMVDTSIVKGYTPISLEGDDTNKFWDKVKAQPFVPLGIAGALATLAFGAYRFRHKGNQSTSVFLMHLRVQAQSVVVGGMTAAILYNIIKDKMHKDTEKS